VKTEGTPHGTRYRTYVRVWLGLLILTGATVSLAGMNLGRLAILSALLIAGAKSGLVLLYFMRLKSERLALFKVAVPLALGVFLVFIILTFSDVAFR
jgi:cytochrome c oxidase subunit IV